MRVQHLLLCKLPSPTPPSPALHLSFPVEVYSTTKYAKTHIARFLIRTLIFSLKKRYPALLSRAVANTNWTDPVSGKDEFFCWPLRTSSLLSLGEDKLPSNFTSPALFILLPLQVNSCQVLTSFEGHAFTAASHSKSTSPWLI